MADDLAEHIRRMGGECVVAPKKAAEGWSAVVALDRTPEQFSGNHQAYCVKVAPEKGPSAAVPFVTVFAAGPQGLKWGLVDLILALDGSPDGLNLPKDFCIEAAPKLDLRGVYAHLHWAYNHPYSLRTWSLDDWKRYIDLLTYLKVNLLQFWPMASILPVPLSDPDRAYLEKYREVVDYARNERGMTVMAVETPNTIAAGDLGVPIEQRDYFEAEAVMNPGDPAQMDMIEAHRAQMYRAIPNASAYSIIDCDPGGWKGSPAEEFVDILLMNRGLLDGIGRTDAELIYWMWWGWGTEREKENWERVLEGMESRLPEPWGLLVCNEDHLRLVARRGHLRRAVYFPYALVEDEPSPPYTHIRFQRIQEALAALSNYGGIRGAMCNAQTPFVQLPNIHRFHRLAWGQSDLERSPGTAYDAVLDLAAVLFPERPEALAKAWSAIAENAGADQLTAAADRLEMAMKHGSLGRSGVAARFLPDEGLMIARDLVAQLRVHAAARRTAGLADAGAPRAAILDSLREYLIAALGWQAVNGYRGRADMELSLLDRSDKECVSRAVSQLAGNDPSSRSALADELASSITFPRPGMVGVIAREIASV
jgi:hypothetical protein